MTHQSVLGPVFHNAMSLDMPVHAHSVSKDYSIARRGCEKMAAGMP